MVVAASVLFVINLLLSLLDASMGYHLAPTLVRIKVDEDGEPLLAAATLRRLLSLVVALFAFLNCAAYYYGSVLVLSLLTAAIVMDVAFQFYVASRLGRA